MADECRPVEADCEVVAVYGAEPMTAADQAFFAEVVRAAKGRFVADAGTLHTASRHDDEQTMDESTGRDE